MASPGMNEQLGEIEVDRDGSQGGLRARAWHASCRALCIPVLGWQLRVIQIGQSESVDILLTRRGWLAASVAQLLRTDCLQLPHSLSA